MKDYISYICESILIILIVIHFVKVLCSKDRAKIWSPISVIAITYIYYCSIPFWIGTIERYHIDENDHNGYLFHLAALLSYVCMLLGFSKRTNMNFSNWNRYFTSYNSGKYGLALFLIGTVCYSMYRGFHISIASDITQHKVIDSYQYYFICMNNLFAAAAALLVVKLKHHPKSLLAYGAILLIYTQTIFAGARWLIIVVVIAMLTSYYLYPRPKKINYIVILSLVTVLFFGFSIMDKSRQRSAGINIEVARALSYNEIKDGAQENYSVYYFSLLSMDRLHNTGERVYFKPFITAALMPIPRSWISWKPDAEYVHAIEDEVFGKGMGGGAAFLNFVEYYMAFGWMGIIVVCYIIGWLSRMFWDNYDSNRDSIGAIIALGTFSAVLYSVISRGYLAGILPNVIFVTFLPFWLTSFLRKFVFKPNEN